MIVRIFLIGLLLSAANISEAQFIFSRTYGFGNVNDGRCVIQTSDHGYAICGSTTPGSGGQTNVYLVKTDSMGIATYHFSYGGQGIDQSFGIVQLPDSGFLIAGYSNSFSVNNDYDAYVVKTDKTGEKIWEKTFGTSDWDFIYDIKPSPDGNFILAGNSFGSSSGISAGYLLKIDTAGNLLWQKFVESDRLINLKRIAVRNDGSFAACGNISWTSSNPDDGFVSFHDSSGDTLRTVSVDGGKYEAFNDLAFYPNGDISLVGNTMDPSTGNADELIMRMDGNGNSIWFLPQSQVGTEEANSLFLKNDTLFMFGSTTTFGQGNSDFHILLFDGNGSFIIGSGHTIGGINNEYCYDALLSNDMGYVMVGTTTSYGPGQQSIYFIKSDSLFSFDPNVIIRTNELSFENNISVFPNPVKNIFHITSPENKIVQIEIFDCFGKLVLEKSNRIDSSAIDISMLNSGLYVCKIRGENFEVKKLIVVEN